AGAREEMHGDTADGGAVAAHLHPNDLRQGLTDRIGLVVPTGGPLHHDEGIVAATSSPRLVAAAGDEKERKQGQWDDADRHADSPEGQDRVYWTTIVPVMKSWMVQR